MLLFDILKIRVFHFYSTNTKTLNSIKITLKLIKIQSVHKVMLPIKSRSYIGSAKAILSDFEVIDFKNGIDDQKIFQCF